MKLHHTRPLLLEVMAPFWYLFLYLRTTLSKRVVGRKRHSRFVSRLVLRLLDGHLQDCAADLDGHAVTDLARAEFSEQLSSTRATSTAGGYALQYVAMHTVTLQLPQRRVLRREREREWEIRKN